MSKMNKFACMPVGAVIKYSYNMGEKGRRAAGKGEMGMKVTAQWIADQCGVSRGTVDRVVNGRPNVAPAVRERVQKMINEYGYKTPAQRQAARAGLGARRIGVILPSWDAFFIRQMREGIRVALHNRGLTNVNVLVEELKNRSHRSYFEAIGRLEEIAALVHSTVPGAVFHVDAIQGYGKFRIRPKTQGIDLLSVSAHKIHGPKGVGFLYIDEKVKIKPILLGGGQQRGMRSGTENVPGIAGLGVAAREAYRDFDSKIACITGLKDYLIDGLLGLEGVTVNSTKGDGGAPQIVSASFSGVRSEVLLHALEDKGIYVSSGSACSSNHPAISGTLRAIGVKKELLDSTLRFSFGMFNTREEIDYCIQVLGELLPVLRRYTRG